MEEEEKEEEEEEEEEDEEEEEEEEDSLQINYIYLTPVMNLSDFDCSPLPSRNDGRGAPVKVSITVHC